MVTVTILTLLRAGWRSPVCCQIQRLLQLFTLDNAAEYKLLKTSNYMNIV